MHPALKKAVETDLDSPVTRFTPVHGGCINHAWKCQLGCGQIVFVKSHKGTNHGDFFAREAEGLQWLKAADCIRVPRVLAVGSAEDAPFLALEWIELGQPTTNYEETLGRQLACLHKSGAATFGLPHPNYLATLAQDNRPCPTWAEFYVERRLQPLVRCAYDKGLLSPQVVAMFESVFRRMHELVGPPEQVARLHGDLWSGNICVDSHGRPVLVDPAVYGGHREIDLAMLQLFGTLTPALFRAYNEVWPLQDDYETRRNLHTLYPLLAHVVLFGGHYVRDTQRALRDYV